MTPRGWLAAPALILWSASALAQGEQPPVGTLPPEEPPAAPAEPAPEQPAPAQPAPAQPAPAQPAAPAGQPPPPPPGYAPYGYPAQPYPPQPYPAPPAPKPEPDPVRYVSITVSPLHLVMPIFEAMLEARIIDGFGASLIGGTGKVTAEDSFGEEYRFDVWELGGQLSWYPLKPFSSLTVGAELLYVHVETEEQDSNVTVTGIGNGAAIGPFIGYKLLTRGGFTLVVQGGVQYLAIEAEASSSAGGSESEETSRVIPLINANIGWSF